MRHQEVNYKEDIKTKTNKKQNKHNHYDRLVQVFDWKLEMSKRNVRTDYDLPLRLTSSKSFECKPNRC